MAFRSPWTRGNDSSIRSSTVPSTTTTTHFSSPFTVYPLFVLHRNRGRCFTAFASNSPSSSSSSSSYGRDNAKRKLRKSGIEEQVVGKTEDDLVPLNRTESKKERRPDITFRSLFGRRALWRRILFASRKVRSILLLNVLTVIYASDIPVLKEVEAIMDPAEFTVVRFALSAIPFIPFLVRSGGDVKTRNSGVELGVWVSLGYLMQALGMLTSDAGRASFISMFTVIVVPLIDGMLGAVIPARTWFGALTSIIGVGMMECSGSPPCVGDLLNILSAIFFGIHMLRTEHISRSTDKENFLPMLGYEICVVALFSAMWYFIGGWFDGIREYNPSSWSWAMFWDWMVAFPWVPALYTGILSTGLCLWVEMAAMCDVSATDSAIIYGLEPVWGAGFAWFLLGERWGISGWIGAALVLGGSLTVQILGVSSPTSARKCEESNKKDSIMLVSEKQNGLSASPFPVHSRKDVSDLLKK